MMISPLPFSQNSTVGSIFLAPFVELSLLPGMSTCLEELYETRYIGVSARRDTIRDMSSENKKNVFEACSESLPNCRS